MKYRDLAEIGLKVLGIYSVIQFLATLPTAFSLNQFVGFSERIDSDYGPEMASFFSKLLTAITSTCVLYLAASVILFLGAKKLAGWLVRSDDVLDFQQVKSAEHLSRFILQLMGVYALITWLPNFIQILVRTIIYGSWQIPQVPTMQRFYENWSLLIGPAVGTVLGLFLLLGTRGMIRIIKLARPLKD